MSVSPVTLSETLDNWTNRDIAAIETLAPSRTEIGLVVLFPLLKRDPKPGNGGCSTFRLYLMIMQVLDWR